MNKATAILALFVLAENEEQKDFAMSNAIKHLLKKKVFTETQYGTATLRGVKAEELERKFGIEFKERELGL